MTAAVSTRAATLRAAVVAATLGTSLSLGAQPRPRPPARPAPAAAPAQPATGLSHAAVPAGWNLDDRDALLQRITQATSDPRNGARNIAVVLLHGVEPSVAAAGLDALAVLGRPEGAEAVMRFLDHRRPSLRRRALVAASRIPGGQALRAIEQRLGDPDASVRVEAARTLADVADATAVSALWLALEHDLGRSLEPSGSRFFDACARAIAARGGADDITRLTGLLRRAPFGAVSDALRAAVARNDLPNPLKLSVVRAIADLSTPQAREVLQRIVSEHRGRPAPHVDFARTAAERIQ